MINSLLNLLKHGLSAWVFLALFGFFLSKSSDAATCNAVSTNSWGSASTWSCGQVPVCGDTIIIPYGYTVTVDAQQDYSGCTPPNVISVYGVLRFQNGNKLRLNCSSRIDIYTGGAIVAGTGGGNSNYIEICSTIVWSANDGTVTGPFTFPEELPITLVSFAGDAKASQVALRWVTSSEINNSYFSVERSANGSDFKQIGMVAGAGNSTSINTYSLIDDNPFQLSYYRLKQVDYDGQYSYSKTIAISLRKTDFEAINIYADHSAQSINVSLNTNFAGVADYTLSDMLGNIISSGTVAATKGINTITLPAGKFAQGIYHFTIRHDGEMITRKVLY